VLRYPIGVQRACVLPGPDGRQEPPPVVVGGVVPLPADAELLRILGAAEALKPYLNSAGDLLIERRIPAAGPDLRLTRATVPKKRSDRLVVRWSAKHPEGAAMTHTVCAVVDRVWRALTLPSDALEVEIDARSLPGGRLAIGVMSTDGFNVSRVRSAAFSLPLAPCIPRIVSPLDGAVLSPGHRIHCAGYGEYPEGDAIESRWLFWSDNGKVDLGPGSDFDVPLRPGKHRITLRAGAPGREASASVVVRVLSEREANRRQGRRGSRGGRQIV
jgi:hypothetical protein